MSGKTYVGIATVLTFFCLIADSIWDKWITPSWWTDAPLGVYCVILLTFGTTKGITYLIDSKFNSPLGQKPGE